jgi:hypothetical protein
MQNCIYDKTKIFCHSLTEWNLHIWFLGAVAYYLKQMYHRKNCYMSVQNFVHCEIKKRWNSASYSLHYVQNLIFLWPIWYLKIAVYKLVLPLLCMGVTLGLILREEHTVKALNNKVLKSVYGPTETVK